MPPLRAAEKRDWLDVVRKHMGARRSTDARPRIHPRRRPHPPGGQSVPARLTAHPTAEQPHVAERGGSAFLLADRLQDINDFPAIIVRSTDSEDDTRTADGTWRIIYDIEVIVACDHRVHGDARRRARTATGSCWRCARRIYSAAGLTGTSTSARVNGPKPRARPRDAPGFRWPPAR